MSRRGRPRERFCRGKTYTGVIPGVKMIFKSSPGPFQRSVPSRQINGSWSNSLFPGQRWIWAAHIMVWGIFNIFCLIMSDVKGVFLALDQKKLLSV